MISLTEEERHALTEHRTEHWTYDLLDLHDQKIGRLATVKTGSFDFNVNSTIRGGGSLEVSETKGIDWLRVRIQPWYHCKAAGLEMEWPLGVFIPASPTTGYTGTGEGASVELYDKLLVLDQDMVEETYGVEYGTKVTDRIKQLLEGVGEVRSAVEESPETLRACMVWEAGTTRLRIINDLLDAINYFSLSVDGRGIYYAGPYVAPTGRGEAWRLADDERSIYLPDFTHDADTFNVPNKYVGVARSDDEEPAMVSVRRNEDPDSPFSYQNRGRWITKVEDDVEATSQKVLDSIADRRLKEIAGVTSNFEVKHAYIPLELNDSVTFVRDLSDIEIPAVLQKFTVSTAVGAPVTSTFREVK